MKISFRHWNIRTKIFSGFSIVIVILMLLSAFSYYSISNINNNTSLLLSGEKVSQLVLELRKYEKDFLLRDIDNLEFYEKQESEYLNKFNQKHVELKGLINELKGHEALEGNEKIKENLGEAGVALHNYYTNFYKVVNELEKKGFKDYGKVGKLSEAIHNLENELERAPNHQELEILILSARRAEKDYLLRGDIKYQDELADSIEKFKSVLEESSIDPDTKEKLNKYITEYKYKFDNVVDIDVKIGLDENSGFKKEYISSIHKLEPIIEELSSQITQDTNKSIARSKRVIMISSIISILFAVAFSIYLTLIITRPIKRTNNMLKNISEGDGDLTKTLTSRTNDELGMLAKSFNLFIGKIRDIVTEVKSSSEILSHSTENLTHTVDRSNRNIEGISKEMNIISDGLQNNSSIVEEITASIQEMASGAEIVSVEATNVTENSKNMLKAANQGMSQLKEVVEKIGNVKHSSNDVYTMIQELKVTSEKIGNIVEIIAGISEQTNLLALNAAIEAARAGEEGKGFAVVAEEVRKLAEQSKSSTTDITSLIEEIGERITYAYDSVKEEQNIVHESVVKADDTNLQFKNILNLIEETVDKMNMIANSANRQHGISKDMATAMDEIARTTESSAASSQQIGASIEEQVRDFEDIARGIDELNRMSDNLKEQTDKFKVK